MATSRKETPQVPSTYPVGFHAFVKDGKTVATMTLPSILKKGDVTTLGNVIEVVIDPSKGLVWVKL